MTALNVEVSSKGVARFYSDFLDCIVIDNKDENLKEEIEKIIKNVMITNTIMRDIDDKINLANIVINSIKQ